MREAAGPVRVTGAAAVRTVACPRPAHRSRRSAAPAVVDRPCTSAAGPDATPDSARPAPAPPARYPPAFRRPASRSPGAPARTGRRACPRPRPPAPLGRPPRWRRRNDSRQRRSADRATPATPTSCRSAGACRTKYFLSRTKPRSSSGFQPVERRDMVVVVGSDGSFGVEKAHARGPRISPRLVSPACEAPAPDRARAPPPDPSPTSSATSSAESRPLSHRRAAPQTAPSSGGGNIRCA